MFATPADADNTVDALGDAPGSLIESDIIHCRLMPTARDASDAAGVVGDRGFAWGRFAFVGFKAEAGPQLGATCRTASTIAMLLLNCDRAKLARVCASVSAL